MCKYLIFLILWITPISKAQDEATCYGPGSIATSVILTIIATVVLSYVLYTVWRRWKQKKGTHLVLETDPERGKNAFAFDNEGFTEQTSTPMDKNLDKSSKLESVKSKWSQWSPLGAFMTKNEKQKTLDDSALQTAEIKTVSLKSHDFTGLGFNIHGNMREGIFIKDILHRGPASESGKLNVGDRIKSITINFDHVVYEDALTILSYASPYEVILEAQSGKTFSNSVPSKTIQLGHPLYKSSSTTDLIKIEKTSKKRLFPTCEDINTSPYSSLQKSASTATTLEKHQAKAPTFENTNKTPKTQTTSPQNLKLQLEQKITQNHKQQLKIKDDKIEIQESNGELQKIDNKYQKFGIKVLPVELKNEVKEQISPKTNELSQNENNINLERNIDINKMKDVAPIQMAIDEVDKTEKKDGPPPIKRREKNIKNNEDVVVISNVENEVINNPQEFIRQGSIGGSGIKRDKDGIPQEIPSHMLNAAVAARRNRKSSDEGIVDDIKSPKKLKGRAPAPPDEKTKSPNQDSELKTNGDETNQEEEEIKYDEEIKQEEEIKYEEENQQKEKVTIISTTKEPTGYASDSDMETDNQSSVNTIELNASDITIHQSEEVDDVHNRRTASTGDLTKIQKPRKISTGTLERAQSLDITDTGIPSLKRKAGSIEASFDSKSGSDESLYGKALIKKEPRLSLALDGLNTFQRSRLKKSTEWGNLEDAILNMDTVDKTYLNQPQSLEQTAEFDALVNKINEIKSESSLSIEDMAVEKTFDNNSKGTVKAEPFIVVSTNYNKDIKKADWPTFDNQKVIDEQKINNISEEKTEPLKTNTTISVNTNTTYAVPEIAQNGISLVQEVNENIKPLKSTSLLLNPLLTSEKFLMSERDASLVEPYYNLQDKMYDTNIPDDIKVSRHSLGSLERNEDLKLLNSSISNISNITISNKSINDVYPSENETFETSKHPENTELFTTALDTTLVNENLLNSINTEHFVGNENLSSNSNNYKSVESNYNSNNSITIEGPTSLTLEINEHEVVPNSQPVMSKSISVSQPEDTSPKSNYSLTYITEIQVITPNSSAESTEETPTNLNSPEPPNKNQKFENYLKNFESNIKHFESQIQTTGTKEVATPLSSPVSEKPDPQKELHKIQEIVEEQLKKLPEMRFTTSSYEAPRSPESCSTQIEQLRSNFEKSPSKSSLKSESGSISKSRIPVATTKTPPTSPERRDSRNFDMEIDKEIVAIMSSPMHSTPISTKYQPKVTRNVSVTSIRSNSKIPSGLPSRPPVPPRKYEFGESESGNRVSTNGSANSSFKQWVFNPSDSSVTNISVTKHRSEQK